MSNIKSYALSATLPRFYTLYSEFLFIEMAKRKHRRRYTGPDLTSHLGLTAGDVIAVKAGEFDDKGAATSAIDGAPISISGAIPRESVSAEVTKIFPDRIATQAQEIKNPSSDRVEAPCDYFGSCSGCQWQHISYQRQLDLKRETVLNALSKYDSLATTEVLPTLASPKRFGYRNHARFTIGRQEHDGKAGFVNADTRRFVPIDRCLIMDDRINDVLSKLQGRLSGMTQFSVRIGCNTGDMIIQPLLPADIQDMESGRQRYEEEIDGVRFRVAASSFFQVNTKQIPNLVHEMVDMLKLDGNENLVDLYCGVGTFSALLSSYVAKVVGIEESSSAIADARINCAGMNNVKFIEARADTFADELATIGFDADILLLDPPRTGCDAKTLSAIASLDVRQLIMVSCEPITMARDLNHLATCGFRLLKIRPIDMFPQTRHVETLSLLQRA